MPPSASRAREARGSALFGLVPACLGALVLLVSCSGGAPHDPAFLTFLIEANPANLDPRYATDGQSQRLDGLLFSSLLERDEQMNLVGDLARSWESPDPLTYVFHLRPGVLFHDNRPVRSADVKATFEFILDPRNRSPKRGAFRMVRSIEAPDDATVVFRLKEPYASFLWNLTRPAIGIVPEGAAADFAAHPVGSGPFRFVAQRQDDEVRLERNERYFRGTPGVRGVRFRVVPDAIVRALELRKGSADLEMSSLSPDMIPVLARQPALAVTERPGSNLLYLGTNLRDPVLARREVRQALAFATDRALLIHYLVRDQARLADGILPPNHWAYEPGVQRYALDAVRAGQLLDAAGFPRQPDGVRLRLMLKTSTDEQARLIGAALQEQWSRAGIQLEVRPLELATLLSDSIKGNFQLNLLRWVGANNDPDAFEFFFSSKRFPPDGANRGHFQNARVDQLADEIRGESDREKRKALCSEVEKILARELPYIPLWFSDVVSVHKRSLGDPQLSPTGDYDFLASPAPASAGR